MKIKHLLLGLLAASLFVNACKKNEDENSTPSPAPGTPAATNPIRAYLADNLNDARQSFTVNASTGGGVQGSGGCHVQFAPGAFRSATGAIITGTVQVKLIEVLSIADMVLLNKQTAGNYGGELRMLTSGGEVKIEASQGGNEVFIVPNGAVVSIPGSNVDPQMRVFSGTEDSDGDVTWNMTEDSIVVQDSAVWDTTGVNWFYYQFTADSLNWLNCDYFPAASVTTMDIDAPDGFDAGNTMVWLVVPALNGVLGGWYYNGLFTTYQAPIGYAAVVVALHQDADDNYFSSFTNITVATGMTVPITFLPTTLAQFEADVNAL